MMHEEEVTDDAFSLNLWYNFQQKKGRTPIEAGRNDRTCWSARAAPPLETASVFTTDYGRSPSESLRSALYKDQQGYLSAQK